MDSPKRIREFPSIARRSAKVETGRPMKNFQIFLKDGHVRYAAADRVEVGRSQVILYAEERIVATYEKSSVIMLDEFQINGFSTGGETGRNLPNPGALHYKKSVPTGSSALN